VVRHLLLMLDLDSYFDLSLKPEALFEGWPRPPCGSNSLLCITLNNIDAENGTQWAEKEGESKMGAMGDSGIVIVDQPGLYLHSLLHGKSRNVPSRVSIEVLVCVYASMGII
jgi:hypothetical protein